jgi:iron-regulated transporter 1
MLAIERESEPAEVELAPVTSSDTKPTLAVRWRGSTAGLHQHLRDWRDFAAHPVFLSSISISALYFTTLSFDGLLISWLKTHSWSNGFLAGMRALTVLAVRIRPVLLHYLTVCRAWPVLS